MGEISRSAKKRYEVKVINYNFQPRSGRDITIAMSLLKNTARFEWFLEKACELGIRQIVPLICARTEKQSFRPDRLKNIMISAMLQSRQTWLPVLNNPVTLLDFLSSNENSETTRFIAHCADSNKSELPKLINISRPAIILIGPEGDFTAAEIEEALARQYIPVSLGTTRLRSETAGVVAASLLTQV